MFTEITGNTELYGQDITSCVIYCRQSCRTVCEGEFPTAVYLVDDLYVISGE